MPLIHQTAKENCSAWKLAHKQHTHPKKHSQSAQAAPVADLGTATAQTKNAATIYFWKCLFN